MKRFVVAGGILLCLGCAAEDPAAAQVTRKNRPAADNVAGSAAKMGDNPKVIPPFTLTVDTAAFSPDGKRVLLAYKGAERQRLFLCMRDAATGKLQFTLGGHEGRVTFCSFLPDGQRVVSAGMDGQIIVQRVLDASVRTIVNLEHAGEFGVLKAAVSSNGNYLLTVSWQRAKRIMQFKVWDLDRGKLIQTFEEPGGIRGLAISPDGTFALTATDSESGPPDKRGKLTLRKTADGQVLQTFPAADGWGFPIAFSADGKGAVVGRRAQDGSGDFCYWDLSTGKHSKTLTATGGAMHLQNIDRDTWCGLTWSKEEPAVGFWDFGAAKRTKIIPLTVPRRLSTTHVLSADGRLALAATGKTREGISDDVITIHIWNLKTGELVHTWKDKTGTSGE